MVEDHDYIQLHNPSAANRFTLDVFAKVRSLADLGLTGVDRPDCGEGIRSISYRERIIFFRVSDTALTILRVLHGHQDISPDLFTDITD